MALRAEPFTRDRRVPDLENLEQLAPIAVASAQVVQDSLPPHLKLMDVAVELFQGVVLFTAWFKGHSRRPVADGMWRRHITGTNM